LQFSYTPFYNLLVLEKGLEITKVSFLSEGIFLNFELVKGFNFLPNTSELELT
jgi:hypothetical protein